MCSLDKEVSVKDFVPNIDMISMVPNKILLPSTCSAHPMSPIAIAVFRAHQLCCSCK